MRRKQGTSQTDANTLCYNIIAFAQTTLPKQGRKKLPEIVGGFYSEVALQKREAEGTVRTKHQLNLDPNPEGTQKNLDDRRYDGREEQRILHVGGGAGAAQGVIV